MQLIESIFFSDSPTAKIVFCIIVSVSFCIVYLWDPTKSNHKRKKRLDNGMLNHFDVESESFTAKAESMNPKKTERRFSTTDNTLNELDQYVKTLKQNQINDLDKV
ncbi:MAG: hypothetical protein P9L94_08415 [Candidatus Hinthialibacter antarcticus]|nr:hypothetical protein [Candidatus Hinthialibacter antarcticus]